MTDSMGWLSIQEASKQTGYHGEHLRRLIRQGKLEARRTGWMWFVNPDSLIAYLKENRGPLGPRHQQGGAEEE